MGMTYRAMSNGKKVSLLGYGAMRFPTKPGSNEFDQDEIERQVKYMLDHGVNYFDTSPAYSRGESERRLGAALEKSGYPRDSYVLATKLSNFAAEQFSAERSRELFENSLKYLRTDYIDNYLLHSIGNGGFETFSKRFIENGMVDWCAEQRAAGRIKNLGFSFHGDPKTFDWCMENHDKYRWDFAMIQMNYIDWNNAKEINARNLDASYLYGELEKRGIPAVIMEPLLGGRLANFNQAIARELTPLDPEATMASWAFRFCGTYPDVITILSGMQRMEHIEENVATFSPLKPCSADELAALKRAAAAYLASNPLPCNKCNYCMPCPYGLDIPQILTFRNECLAADKNLSAKETLAAYARFVPEELRRADHCTACGKCNPHCPQQINIPEEIAAIDRVIDGLKGEVLR